ncbi:oligosaccharyl transferase, archaeosortase A system-associated [Candidatus Pacearchaeota archaeon]|nr:oligosaccharyl transferase, archaeosortase A system-associated [Candidatus Pacearchaeota archaeon]
MNDCTGWEQIKGDTITLKINDAGAILNISTCQKYIKSYITQNKKHVIAIILVFFITLAIRMLSINEVFVDGNVIYYGYDSYYHMRRVVYTVLHFPTTLWYDSYLAYPSGFEITWAPLYDITIAFIAILVSFGSPDIHTIEIIGAIFPAVLGALTVVLVYILTTKIFDTRVGLLSALLLAISSAHIRVSILGKPDHHVAEVFLFIAVILIFTIIIDKISITKKTINNDESTKPTNNQRGKNKKNLKSVQSKNAIYSNVISLHPINYINKKTIIGSITLGILITALVLTWVGAPIYLAIFILYFFMQYCFNVYYLRFSSDIVFISGTAFLTSLIILIPFYLSTDWMPIYQILTIVIFLFISIIFGVIANITIKKRWRWYIYPIFIIAIATISFISVKQLLPQYYKTILGGFSYLAVEGILSTIVEATPLFDSLSTFILEMFFSEKFGLNLLFATCGVVLYLINGVVNLSTKKEIKHSYLLLIIVTISTFILTIYQQRFAYLFSVFAAIFASYLFYKLSDLGLETYISKSKELKSLNKSTKKRRKSNNQELKRLACSEIPPVIFILLLLIAPSAYSSYVFITTPPLISNEWYDAAEWLKINTPETSYYNDPVKLPEYSVMSWWDYGNWIQYIGNRPIVANNFQTGVYAVAKYFTATNESVANTILDKHATKYVVVDTATGYGYKDMVSGKYYSVLNIAGKNNSDYRYSFEYPTPFYTINQLLLSDAYYNTLFARLLLLDGSSIVNPNNNRADALSHYRLVYESGEVGIAYDNYVNISTIKIFEYVPGAVIKGRTIPNSEVEISIPVTTNQNRTFTYINHGISDTDGSFEFIVPYTTHDVSDNTKPQKTKYNITVNGVLVSSLSVNEEQILNHEIISIDVVGTNLPVTNIDERKTNPIVMDVAWSYDTNGNIKYAPAIIEDLLYVVSDNDIFSININERTLSFKQYMGGQILTPFSKKETDLYFVSMDNYNIAKIYVIDYSGIKGKITLPNTHPIKTISPLQIDDKLYIGINNLLYAIDTSSGLVEWKFEGLDHFIAKPTSIGDTIYITSYNGTAYALNASSGSVKWTSALKNKSWTPLVYADKVLVTGTRDDFINGLDFRSGEVVWKYKTGYFVDSTPVFLDGVVYVASYDGKIYALDSQNGNLIWKSDQFAPIFAKPVIFNDKLFVGTWDGKFYKIDIATGETIAFSDLDEPIISSALILNDMAYVTTFDGKVYAIRI